MNKEDRQPDALTGLLRRLSFEERLAETMEQAGNEGFPLALAFLDIDDFKAINDTYGHPSGDRTLATVADAIKANVDPRVVIARYGGDEFAILFPSTEREQAFLALERIRADIERLDLSCLLETAEQSEEALHVTLSAGVASLPIDAQQQKELVRKADQALYRAKTSGRNQVRLAYEERMVPKTSHYTETQLERLSKLADAEGVGEAVLLREALDNLLMKYQVTRIET